MPSSGRRCRLLSLYAFLGDGDAPRPVAWLISSAVVIRELVLELVLALAQLSAGRLEAELPAPRYFVAEKYSVFHQAWCEATGQRPMRLLDQAKVRATLSTMLIKHVKVSGRAAVAHYTASHTGKCWRALTYWIPPNWPMLSRFRSCSISNVGEARDSAR